MVVPGMYLADRYEILEKIGSGGMSDVYKAKDHKLNRLVAVKVLKHEFSVDATFVKKFRVEAQSAAGLSHPNIVNVYDVGEESGIHYIVMELVQGITLKKYIEMKGKLDIKEALNISVQIASGLQAAHDNRIIHRDIKPQNIIMSRDGKVKVTDFGIAKVADSTTVTTNAAGSVHYISPEQARGGYSDAKSDIYSLGITMYEMLTGRVPFEGETNVAVALLHIQGEMVPPRKLEPSIPRSFEKIILKCTQKKPDRRYATARELIADLRKVLTHPDGDYVVLTGLSPAANEQTMVLDEENVNRMRMAGAGGTAGSMSGGSRSGYGEDAGRGSYGNSGSSGGAAGYGSSSQNRGSMGGQNRSGAGGNGGQAGSRTPSGRNGSNGQRPDDGRGGRNSYSGNNGRKVADYDEDEDNDNVNPALEKVMMVLGIVGAVILVVVIFFVIGRAAGLFSGGGESKESQSIESQSETETDKETQSESDSESETDEEVEVPDLLNLTESQAQIRAGEKGLYISVELVEKDDVDDGLIFEQSPKKGEKIKRGEIIQVKVAKAEQVTIDTVEGLTLDQAKNTITVKGLVVSDIIYEYSDTIPEDKAIRTNPEAGTKVEKGQKVVLYMSKGKEVKKVSMPQVVGYTLEEAKSILQQNKLSVGSVDSSYSDEVAEGKIISASVSYGTEVDEGTTINLVVSKGKENRIYTGYVGILNSPIDGLEDGQSAHITVTVYKPDGTSEVIANGDYKQWVPLEENVTSTVAGNGHYEIAVQIRDSEGNTVDQYTINQNTEVVFD